MEYSYVPNNMIKLSENMNFYERTMNTLVSQFENVYMEFVHYERQVINIFCFYWMKRSLFIILFRTFSHLQRKIFAAQFSHVGKTFDEQMKDISLVFINHHFSTSSIRPLVANMIEIGGIHVQPAKPLPDDIQKFLDSADEGVILFTMGSILQGVDWPVEKRNAFVRAFGKLKQKVLWKYENETLPNNPGNIMIKSWIPQRDILAHPNVKLFITHGGLLGTTEAVVEGVPMLGIPIYSDQKMNILQIEAKGFGILLEFSKIDQKLIEQSLDKILNEPSYQINAKLNSNRFNDRINSPEETTVFWVEYVVRHRGAPHMKSPAHNLTYFQRNLIDVYSSLAIIFIAILSANVYIMRKIFCKSKTGKKLKQN